MVPNTKIVSHMPFRCWAPVLLWRVCAQRQSDFDSAIPRFESWRPSQPPGSLPGSFGYPRKCRHFRRLAAKRPVSGVEPRPSRAEKPRIPRRVSAGWVSNIRNLRARLPRDRLRFRLCPVPAGKIATSPAFSVNARPRDPPKRTVTCPWAIPSTS